MKFQLKQTVNIAVNNSTAVGTIVAYRIKNRGIGRDALIEYKMKLGSRFYWVPEDAVIGLHEPEKTRTTDKPKLHPASNRMSWLRRAWNQIISLFKQIGR
jgi:hypothetical protein